MKTFSLQLADDTIKRLEECGDSHTAGSLGNEILGMALLDAYQHNKRQARVALNLGNFTLKTRKVPATAPKRITFALFAEFARSRGVAVQMSGRKVEFWRKGAEHTTGETATIAEAWAEIESGAI